jgi:hypothetical protein
MGGTPFSRFYFDVYNGTDKTIIDITVVGLNENYDVLLTWSQPRLTRDAPLLPSETVSAGIENPGAITLEVLYAAVYEYSYIDKDGSVVESVKVDIKSFPPTPISLTDETTDDESNEDDEDDDGIAPVVIPLTTKPGDVIRVGERPGELATTPIVPINWIVLEVKDGMALLLSESVFPDRHYMDTTAAATWEASAIRTYLNTEFINTMFKPEERAAIIRTNIVTDNNP